MRLEQDTTKVLDMAMLHTCTVNSFMLKHKQLPAVLSIVTYSISNNTLCKLPLHVIPNLSIQRRHTIERHPIPKQPVDKSNIFLRQFTLRTYDSHCVCILFHEKHSGVSTGYCNYKQRGDCYSPPHNTPAYSNTWHVTDMLLFVNIGRLGYKHCVYVCL